MAARKQKFDEFYEKPSKHRRWNESGLAPVSTRSMSIGDIKQFQALLAESYNANQHEVRHTFERITDENDEDRTDSLWVRYWLKCVVDGTPQDRNIYSAKILVPDDIKSTTQSFGSSGAKRAPARARALPAPESAGRAPQMRHPRAPSVEEPGARKPGRRV